MVPRMLLGTLFLAFSLAQPLDLSSLTGFTIDLKVDVAGLARRGPNRTQVDLVKNTQVKVKDLFEEPKLPYVSTLIYRKEYANSSGNDSRRIGWNILQGRYLDEIKDLSAEQLNLVIEWSRIMVVFPMGLEKYTHLHSLMSLLSRFSFIGTHRKAIANQGSTLSRVQTIKDLNSEFWDAMHSLALNRLKMTGDDGLAKSVANLFEPKETPDITCTATDNTSLDPYTGLPPLDLNDDWYEKL